ncbi:hypothetical protein AnigIFM50267_005153, partial [Aspergillus niger]
AGPDNVPEGMYYSHRSTARPIPQPTRAQQVGSGGFSGCGKAFTPLDQIQLPRSPVELGPKRQTDKRRWSDPPKRMMGRPVTIFGRKIYLLQPTIIQAVLQAFSASGTRLTQSFLAIYFRDNSIVMDGFALPVEYDPLWRGEIIAHCV